MEMGGVLVEGWPPSCESGHAWGPPVNGVVRVITGWRPCHCAGTQGGIGGHRYFHCEKPGCETPWTLQPPCFATTRATIWTRPEPIYGRSPHPAVTFKDTSRGTDDTTEQHDVPDEEPPL